MIESKTATSAEPSVFPLVTKYSPHYTRKMDWGDDSVGRALTAQVRGPEFESPDQHKVGHSSSHLIILGL